jgi:hypothetical protein
MYEMLEKEIIENQDPKPNDKIKIMQEFEWIITNKLKLK